MIYIITNLWPFRSHSAPLFDLAEWQLPPFPNTPTAGLYLLASMNQHGSWQAAISEKGADFCACEIALKGGQVFELVFGPGGRSAVSGTRPALSPKLTSHEFNTEYDPGFLTSDEVVQRFGIILARLFAVMWSYRIGYLSVKN